MEGMEKMLSLAAVTVIILISIARMVIAAGGNGVSLQLLTIMIMKFCVSSPSPAKEIHFC
jgi:hypothetical protein